VRDRLEISARSLRNQCAIAAKSVRNRCAIARKSLHTHYAIVNFLAKRIKLTNAIEELAR
jgi:hypothetical protein